MLKTICLSFAAMAAAASFAGSAFAASAPINPGDSFTLITTDDGELATGELVDEKTIDFDVDFQLSPALVAQGNVFATHPVIPAARGQFKTSVYRDTDTGHLSFLYQVHDFDFFLGANASEVSRLFYSSFEGFETVITGRYDAGAMIAGRSADGSEISLRTIVSGANRGSFQLFVETNATEYNDQGDVRWFIIDEFNYFHPDFPEEIQTNGEGSVDIFFTGTFQPVPIPLPAAAWTGLATLAGAGAVWRKRRAS